MTNTESTIPSPVSKADTERMIVQIIEAAGDDGIVEADLIAAMDAMESLAFSVVLWETWKQGRTRVGWDAAAGELMWRAAEAAS